MPQAAKRGKATNDRPGRVSHAGTYRPIRPTNAGWQQTRSAEAHGVGRRHFEILRKMLALTAGLASSHRSRLR
jgi:hypothetical protein